MMKDIVVAGVRGMKNAYKFCWEMFQKMISWKAEKKGVKLLVI
jgi:transposase